MNAGGSVKSFIKLWFILTVALIQAACPGRREQPVEDRAGLLSTAEVDRLGRFHRHLLQELDIELKVLVLAESPGDIDRAAVELFEDYGVGRRTRAARGVLLLVDPPGRQVRMEIGYDLEGIFPDGFIGYVEEGQMAPFFQAGRIGDGVEATVELLVGRALGEVDASDSAVGNRPAALDHLSGGGGARIAVDVGSGPPEKGRVADAVRFSAQATPSATLRKYLEVLRGHIKDPDLGLYSPETRHFFRRWLVTDGQQDNELRGLLAVMEQGTTRIEGDRAVIRFPVEERRVSPYFFVRGEQGWMLDLASMSRLIGFNQNNQWFFRRSGHVYMFAFDDLRFDKNGFPHESR
jgi:uncharacterized protein